MRLSPLLLKDYFTTELAFSASSNFESGSDNPGIDVDDLNVEVQEFKNEKSILDRACQISIELKENNEAKYPYDFSITLVGFFEVDSAWDPEKLDLLVSSNAPALLYSAARHALASVTGTGPFNKIILPSVSFVQFSNTNDQKPKDIEQPTKKKLNKPRKSLKKD